MHTSSRRDFPRHPSVAVCWNCNSQDLQGQGLEHNFNLVKKRLGATTHIHELTAGAYPFQQLISLLVQADYAGWALLECSSMPKDRVAAMAEQRVLFESKLAAAQKR